MSNFELYGEVPLPKLSFLETTLAPRISLTRKLRNGEDIAK